MDWLEVWESTAAKLGGALWAGGATTRLLRAELTDVSLEVELAGVAIHAVLRRTGDQMNLTTAIDCAAPGAGDLRLRVSRGFVYAIGKRLFGIQDLECGDPLFDDRHVVKGTETAVARAWLDERARRAIMLTDGYTYALERGRVAATRVGYETDARALELALQAVAALGSRGSRMLAQWSAAAARLGGRAIAGGAGAEGGGGDGGAWAADGSARIELSVRGRPVVIDSVRAPIGGARGKRRLQTRATARRTALAPSDYVAVERTLEAPLPSGLPRIELHDAGFADLYDVRGQDAAHVARRIGAETRAALRGLGAPAAVLALGGDVRVVVPGFEADPDRLGKMADLAELLGTEVDAGAGSTRGPYR